MSNETFVIGDQHETKVVSRGQYTIQEVKAKLNAAKVLFDCDPRMITVYSSKSIKDAIDGETIWMYNQCKVTAIGNKYATVVIDGDECKIDPSDVIGEWAFYFER